MDVQDLAKRRIELKQRLECLGMINIYGVFIEDRIELETRIIKAERELVLTERMINAFVNAKESQ